MKEYFLHYWGGALSTIEANCPNFGIKLRNSIYCYFPTENDRAEFIKRISVYKHLGLMIDKKEGEMTHKRTVVFATFKYQDKTYDIQYDFGFEYEDEAAIFMFSYGNYGCDCNRSGFIEEKYPDFPEMECGHEIEMVNFEIKHLDMEE